MTYNNFEARTFIKKTIYSLKERPCLLCCAIDRKMHKIMKE